MILTEEKKNIGRQVEFDIVKVLSIVFMVIIHVYEEMTISGDILPVNLYDNILQFVAGPLTAPVFMISMGVSMIYSKHREPKDLILRGIKIFVISYVLNFFRYVLPFIVVGQLNYVIYALIEPDILQFAGLAFILVGIFKKIKINPLVMVLIAVGMQLLGQIFSAYLPIDEDQYVLRMFVGLFYYTGTYTSFFPLLLWFIYPALGVFFAKYLRHVGDSNKFYGLLGVLSIALLIGLCGSLYFNNYDLRNFYTLNNDLYYIQDFLSVLFTIACVGLELSLVHFISKLIKSKNILNGINYLSSNLNKLYLGQWIIIGWLEFFIEVPSYLVIPIGLLIYFVDIVIITLINKTSNNIKSKKKLVEENNK